MMYILYTLLYFIIGFIVAKFYKTYHQLNNIQSNVDYATFGILWLPRALIFIFVNGIAFVHKLYKSKL